MIDPDPTDTHDWRMAALNDLRRRDALAHAPDCGDPDHPGCPKCEPDPMTEGNIRENGPLAKILRGE